MSNFLTELSCVLCLYDISKTELLLNGYCNADAKVNFSPFMKQKIRLLIIQIGKLHMDKMQVLVYNMLEVLKRWKNSKIFILGEKLIYFFR